MANSLWRRPPSLFPKETLINMFHADAYRTSHLYYIIKMIRVLSITRSGPLIVSMSDFFLSIASGLFAILAYNYFVPLITSQDNDYSLFSVLYSLLFVTGVKAVFQAGCAWFDRRRGERKLDWKEVSVRKLIYTVSIKVAAYLSFIFLLVAIDGITFSLAIFLTFLFVFSLQYCSKNDLITKILWKGRSLGTNKVKILIMGMLVLGSIVLQPLSYGFYFELHFEIFIILTSSLVFFSYYYLHKLFLAVTPKDHLPILVCQISALESLFLLLLTLYYVVMEDNGLSFSQQLDYMGDNALILMAMVLLGVVYEAVMIESLKKVAVSRLIITQITGMLWFNIYTMSQAEIQLPHYISTIVLLFVLLVNIDLFSEENMRGLLGLLNKKKKKKTTFTEMEMKESENDH